MGKLLVGLQVRDPFGRGQAFGTAATVQRTDGALAPSEVQDTLNIFSVYGVEGTFSVTNAPDLRADAGSGARTSILVSLHAHRILARSSSAASARLSGVSGHTSANNPGILR